MKVVLWIEEIQGFSLQKFKAKCPVAGLDEKTLFVIKDCIEWRNEALAQAISEIKEILDNLKLMDEIIQNDLKWFGKHCVGKESDSIALVEELVSEIQRKFHEVQEKRHHARRISPKFLLLRLC